MSRPVVFKECKIVNEGQISVCDILVSDGRIERIDPSISVPESDEFPCDGMYMLPGLIDDQVHFREPGLTHKANIYTESRAAAAGGVTSFMEMPNTVPQTLTQELLEDKYRTAAQKSLVNYSFYMGVSYDNYDEVMNTDPKQVCGIKIFMGSSTGNMLVDDESYLEKMFSNAPTIIVTHCEDEQTIRHNEQVYKRRYGDEIPVRYHPEIRSREACLLSSELAIKLARKTDADLHILHISTKEETQLFSTESLENKKITAEVCAHHLFFHSGQYNALGTRIKCNPAIKEQADQQSLLKALKEGRLDILATDHAPHTVDEKSQNYWNAPAGLPLVQHALPMMLTFFHSGDLQLTDLVKYMCHNPAIRFNIRDRGFLREGYWADFTLIDPDLKWKVEKDNILYKCGWSPLEGKSLRGKVLATFVNGTCVYRQDQIISGSPGKRLTFDR
jgi:dihydroorotase